MRHAREVLWGDGMTDVAPRTIKNIQKDIAAEVAAMGLLAGEFDRLSGSDPASKDFLVEVYRACLPAFAPRFVELSRELVKAKLAAAKGPE